MHIRRAHSSGRVTKPNETTPEGNKGKSKCTREGRSAVPERGGLGYRGHHCIAWCTPEPNANPSPNPGHGVGRVGVPRARKAHVHDAIRVAREVLGQEEMGLFLPVHDATLHPGCGLGSGMGLNSA